MTGLTDLTGRDGLDGSSGLPPGFDPAYYLLVHGEVAEAGMDPAEHYLRHGRAEGRTGVPPRPGYVTERDAQGRADFFIKAFSAIATNGIQGPYLEFGVGRGLTLWLAWQSSRAVGLDTALWAFDSFEGLPAGTTDVDTSHPNWVQGAYANAQDGVAATVSRLGVDLGAVTFVPGFYSESVAPDRRGDLPTTASLVYIDCDMYDSTRDALAYLDGVIGHGTIVGFDDYFCWSPTRSSGEQVALDEFLASRPDLTFNPFQPIGWHGMSFYVTTDRGAAPQPAPVTPPAAVAPAPPTAPATAPAPPAASGEGSYTQGLAFGGESESAARWFAQDPAWWSDHHVGAPEQIREFLESDGIALAGSRVLDLGCGDGIMALGLAGLGPAQVEGTDLEPVDLDFLRDQASRHGIASLPPTLSFTTSVPDHIPAPDASYDVVTAWSVFEHVTDPGALLREVHRVLRPDGAFFLQIWPMWHSENGAHVWPWTDQGFEHLVLDDAAMSAHLRGRIDDPATAQSFVDLYRSCSRITIDELQVAIVDAGFYLAKVSLQSDTFHVRPELQRVPISQLGVSGIKLLAIRH